MFGLNMPGVQVPLTPEKELIREKAQAAQQYLNSTAPLNLKIQKIAERALIAFFDMKYEAPKLTEYEKEMERIQLEQLKNTPIDPFIQPCKCDCEDE